MIRMFLTHKVRKIQELEGIWDFTKASDDDSMPDFYDFRLPVPGCWESHPLLNTYRGKGWYRTTITLDRPTSLRLEFKGVSHTVKVFVDGIEIGGHYNAYTPFSIVVPDAEAGEHEIHVLVDNSFSEASSLHIPNDYYTYGGLIRPVVMEEIADVFIERLHVTPIYRNESWSADVKVVVRNLTPASVNIQLRGMIGDIAWETETVSVSEAGVTEARTTVQCPDVRPWSASEPNLYTVEGQLFVNGQVEPLDDCIERIGFREIKAQGNELFLNGQKLSLKGYCRHEDHPLVGASLPLQLMMQDLDLIQQSGANSVRTTHYPNDERFLDLCDERGLYVWEENHARGLELPQMQNPHFDQQCEDCNREMVDNHFNHPSIIIWGILNECASDKEEGRVKYERQLSQIRAMDASRPLSYATYYVFTDLCLDLVDIISFNIYPGWYFDDEPGDYCDRLKAWADQAGGEGKPMIISEFGGDGFYGFRSPLNVKGSEERQAQIIGDDIRAFQSRPYISGMFIWQFCDCRVTEEGGWAIRRALTKNSKGIFDEYRRPKLAYHTVSEYYHDSSSL